MVVQRSKTLVDMDMVSYQNGKTCNITDAANVCIGSTSLSVVRTARFTNSPMLLVFSIIAEAHAEHSLKE